MAQFFKVWFYDGESAARRTVEIQTVGKQFLLLEQERRHGPFDFDALTHAADHGSTQVYGLSGHEGWRLGITGPLPDELTRLLPAKGGYGRWVDRLGLSRAAIVFTAFSAAAVAVVLWWPQWLAPIIPSGIERNLGDAMVGDLGGRFCHTSDGTAALKKLARAIDPKSENLQVEVAKIDMLNAVAVPGNKIIIFNGLLKKVPDQDAVAGVLAHEMGHVRKRHVMQGLLRQMGLSLVLGGIGGKSGDAMNSLLGIGYTRDAEREADSYSIAALKSAHISPKPTADFFDTMEKETNPTPKGVDEKTGKMPVGKNDTHRDELVNSLGGYLASHPVNDARKNAFSASFDKQAKYHSILSNGEWESIKIMCAKDKKAKSGFGFDL
jgi:beta-barrel assembly-enhancing protease